MKILIATHNKGKLREIAEILKEHECIPLSGDCEPPEETGSTFLENARIKALAALGDMPVIAEDSGLCVDALGGAPGIYSARYGDLDTDDERNVLLLSQLENETNRAAYFFCAAVCLFPDGRELTATGRCDGVITRAPRGSDGFGYDPIFEIDGVTTAELVNKNEVSHRGKAFRMLSELLEGLD